LRQHPVEHHIDGKAKAFVDRAGLQLFGMAGDERKSIGW
jgi:hypothetical protein